MLQSEESDEELMAQYQEGSEEAFRMLYSRHSGKIFGYLKSRVRTEEFAADLFQEVFVKVHRSKALYNKSLPVLPWLFSITQSVMIDGLRQKDRRKEVFDHNFDQTGVVEGKENSKLATVTPFIKNLPDQQQVALQMRYVNENTFEEIAKTLKTTPMNVRQIISRSVRQLREIVKGDKS